MVLDHQPQRGFKGKRIAYPNFGSTGAFEIKLVGLRWNLVSYFSRLPLSLTMFDKVNSTNSGPFQRNKWPALYAKH
jgi:hypothetical protein